MSAYNGLLNEQLGIVWGVAPANYTGTTGNGPWVSLKQFNQITFGIITGAWAGGTAAVTVQQATAVAGTGAKALALITGGGTSQTAAGGPVLYTYTSATDIPTKTAISSNTFNLSAANQLYVFSVQASTLDLANNFTCVQLQIASPGGNNDFYGHFYLLSQGRFDQGLMPSAMIN